MDSEEKYRDLLKKYNELAAAIRIIQANDKEINKLILRVERVETKAAKNNEEVTTLKESFKASDKNHAAKIDIFAEMQEDKTKLVYKRLTKINKTLRTEIDNVTEKIKSLDEEYRSVKKFINSRTEENQERQINPDDLPDKNIQNEYTQQGHICDCHDCSISPKPGQILKYANRNYSCNICGEMFNVKWLLENHVKQHTSQTQYPCNVCGKIFYLKWRLKKHMSVHKSDVQIRSCHFYNNGKECPFAELGCKYLHQKAPMCKYQTKCKFDKCQFRHE